MLRAIPINTTYLKPYIDASFRFLEHGVGAFVEQLGDYGIVIKKHNEPGEHKIFINFAIDNHVFDSKIYFYIKETDTFGTLDLKIETAAEEIIRTIKNINDPF